MPEKPKDVLDTPAPAPTVKDETVEPKAEVKTEAETEVKKTVESKPEPATIQSGGKWQIQLIASKNKAAVEQTWNNLAKKYVDLQKYTHEIQTTDLGAQGIFYRLRAGAFASRDEAAKACATLKAKGLRDCIAKER